MLLLDKSRIAARLSKDEGTGPVHDGRYYPYPDTVGKLTIGTGRNLTDKGVSDAERRLMLDSDIAESISALTCYEWFATCPPTIQDVLVCIMFNLGAATFAEFKDAIAALGVHDYGAASAAFAASAWDEQVGHRATLYESILRTGIWLE